MAAKSCAPHRRQVVGGAGALFVYLVGGCAERLTPEEARAAGAAFRVLAPDTVRVLDRLGDVLVPGTTAAGFTHFIDAVSAGPREANLSILRYMDWPGDAASFYRDGAAGLDQLAAMRFGRPFTETSDADAASLIGAIAAAQPEGWAGPPAPLFYFVARSDAVDVYYGSPEGFDRLQVERMHHIDPPKPW